LDDYSKRNLKPRLGFKKDGDVTIEAGKSYACDLGATKAAMAHIDTEKVKKIIVE
jgi:hypothetical protein